MHKPRLTEPMKRLILALDAGAVLSVAHLDHNRRYWRQAVLFEPGTCEVRAIAVATWEALTGRRIVEPRNERLQCKFGWARRWELSDRGHQVATELKRESVAQ